MTPAAQPGVTRVGFVGLGVMGAAMARNLLEAGFALTVHNRSKAKAAALVEAGAADGGTPAGVGRAADIVFTCLPDTPDVEAVLFGRDGLAEAMRPDSVVIDTSTIAAPATASLAARLRERGIHMLDCPVSGGPKGAVDGTLTCMIGGDEAVLERCRPALAAIGKSFTHIGGNGAGQLCKSCNQLLVMATMLGVAEAVALCKKSGIDPYRMREALLGGSAQSFVLQNHAKRLLDGTLAPGFRGALMLKDLKLALDAGRECGAFQPVTALAAQLLAAHCSAGGDALDSAAIGLLFQQLSGLPREPS